MATKILEYEVKRFGIDSMLKKIETFLSLKSPSNKAFG
jgi:hypothetical protein